MRDQARRRLLMVCWIGLAVLASLIPACTASDLMTPRAGDQSTKGVPTGEPTSRSDCRLFILAGQSNMVGRGRVSELPAEGSELPENVQVYAVALDAALHEPQGTFGPELELSRALGRAYSEQPVVLVKYAVDASSLLDWAPDWSLEEAQITGNPGFGALYQQLLDLEVWVAEEAEPGCQPTAVFWMQGERDARIGEAGRRYQKNLTALIQRLRQDLDATELPFILGQVNPPQEYFPAVEEVRTAQAEVVQRLSHTRMVSTEGLTKWPDELHYDTAGQLELGRRFAQAFLAMAGP